MIIDWHHSENTPEGELKISAFLDSEASEEASRLEVRLTYPVILPAVLADMGWPGPIDVISGTPFAIVWAEATQSTGRNARQYVNHKAASNWVEDGKDWRRIAFGNLRSVSDPDTLVGKDRPDGKAFIKAMIQQDLLGPSRLLIPHLLVEALGPGYMVSIPVKTCAIAFRRSLEPEEEVVISGIINESFARDPEPFSVERFPAEAFWKLATDEGW